MKFAEVIWHDGRSSENGKCDAEKYQEDLSPYTKEKTKKGGNGKENQSYFEDERKNFHSHGIKCFDNHSNAKKM